MRRDLAHWPAHGSFNHVFANPPFHEEGKVKPSPILLEGPGERLRPRGSGAWIKVLHTMVTLRGTCTIVHRAESLGTFILAAMQDRFGDIRVAPLYRP